MNDDREPGNDGTLEKNRLIERINRFEILGSGSVRPDAEQILFCDGTDDRLFRGETDLELSHWRPNRTPVKYRAGTSTEICFRFLDNPQPGSWTVAVNNHVDMDGILSVYALVRSCDAMPGRETLIQAAEMGDFWGWGELPAQRVFQGVSHLMKAGLGAAEVYHEAFRRIPGLIDGTDLDVPTIEKSLAPLTQGVQLVEQGKISRQTFGQRLAGYIIPLDIAGTDDARASYVPEFNEAISLNGILWPQVRAKWDAQRVCLVSTERHTGWFHDLWFPGYHWADTEGFWQVPGLKYSDGMRDYVFDNPTLVAAFGELQRQEPAMGQWGLGGSNLPFGDKFPAQFPLAGRFLDGEGHAAISQLSPEHVTMIFNGIFD
jgi:hypothetical protein